MAKRTFEYEDDKSRKFWAIEVDGSEHTVQYGKIGTTGQEKTKAFESSEDAEASAEKLIKQKTRKGYVEIGNESGGASKTKKKSAKKTPATKGKGLSTGVLKELKRLGAVKRDAPLDRTIQRVEEAIDMPEPIRQFVQDYDWPEEARYSADEDSDLEFELDQVNFAYDPLETCDEYSGCEDRNLVMIGFEESSGYVIAVDLDDKKLADPLCYYIDQEDIDSDEPLSLECRLSKLMAKLKKDE